MTGRPKRLRQKSWDWKSAQYADLSHPEWLDPPVPNGFWNDEENHKRYAIWLGRKLGFKKMEDWYQVTTKDFTNNHGTTILRQFADNQFRVGKRIQFLRSIFPQYPWKPWLLSPLPAGFWSKRENRVQYMKWLGKQLGYQKKRLVHDPQNTFQ